MTAPGIAAPNILKEDGNIIIDNSSARSTMTVHARVRFNTSINKTDERSVFNNLFIKNRDYKIIVGMWSNAPGQPSEKKHSVVSVSNIFPFPSLIEGKENKSQSYQFQISVPSIPLNATTYKYDYYLYGNNALYRLQLISQSQRSNSEITKPTEEQKNDTFNPYVFKENKTCGRIINPLTFIIPNNTQGNTQQFSGFNIRTVVPIKLKTDLSIMRLRSGEIILSKNIISIDNVSNFTNHLTEHFAEDDDAVERDNYTVNINNKEISYTITIKPPPNENIIISFVGIDKNTFDNLIKKINQTNIYIGKNETGPETPDDFILQVQNKNKDNFNNNTTNKLQQFIQNTLENKSDNSNMIYIYIVL